MITEMLNVRDMLSLKFNDAVMVHKCLHGGVPINLHFVLVYITEIQARAIIKIYLNVD
jgi:hypothetical protein